MIVELKKTKITKAILSQVLSSDVQTVHEPRNDFDYLGWCVDKGIGWHVFHSSNLGLKKIMFIREVRKVDSELILDFYRHNRVTECIKFKDFETMRDIYVYSKQLIAQQNVGDKQFYL
jgi:hypothetical protein